MEHSPQGAITSELRVIQQIRDALNVLIARAQEELLEYGTFEPIREVFVVNIPQLYCRNIDLAITHPSSLIKGYMTRRYFDLNVRTPSDKSAASCLMAVGNRAEVLSQITTEGFAEKLQKKLFEMANELESDSFG